MSETKPEPSSYATIWVVAIIAAGVVLLGCIAASTWVAMAFLNNAPW